MKFEITEELIATVEQLIANKSDTELGTLLSDLHYADIAEVLGELQIDQATYLVKIIDSEKSSDTLMELEEDFRDQILEQLSVKEIAEELEEMDTDDAADVIAELPEERQEAVILEIVDEEHAENIVELLSYDENTAGGLMAKELVMVKETWTVTGCVRNMRAQAQNVTRVHSIYVVDHADKLIGRLSLKNLLVAPDKAKIKEIYIPKVDSVTTTTEAEEVARIMQKYDLEAIPVVDEDNVLVGRITIDDIVDFIKDEAEKDYQMAAGITQEVVADDNVWDLTRARLPWLVLGLFGGLGSVFIMGSFHGALDQYPVLFFFTPLIAAMAGNVGVQSSAIIVQGLANDNVKGSLLNRLLKEVSLGLINGIALATLLIGFGVVMKYDMIFNCTVALALISVIIVAALVGTFVPIILNKKGIDPAIATGPFITTSNDIFGIFIFFYIAKVFLGF